MSTLTKLDPRVRRDRQYRRMTIRSLSNVLALLQRLTPPPLERIGLAGMTLDILTDIRRNPRMTGAAKRTAFADLIKLLEDPNDRSAVESGAS